METRNWPVQTLCLAASVPSSSDGLTGLWDDLTVDAAFWSRDCVVVDVLHLYTVTLSLL